MDSNSIAVQILREVVRRRKLQEALRAKFETVPSDPRFCVRRADVVAHAARALDIRVVNNDVFIDVERAAIVLGWEPVKNGGRSLFPCVKRKGQDHTEALAGSQEQRLDPRWPRHSV
jgi:hypothetical protein